MPENLENKQKENVPHFGASSLKVPLSTHARQGAPIQPQASPALSRPSEKDNPFKPTQARAHGV